MLLNNPKVEKKIKKLKLNYIQQQQQKNINSEKEKKILNYFIYLANLQYTYEIIVQCIYGEEGKI